jgi:hypothetical protein
MSGGRGVRVMIKWQLQNLQGVSSLLENNRKGLDRPEDGLRKVTRMALKLELSVLGIGDVLQVYQPLYKKE